MFGGMGQMGLQSLLVVMDGIDNPPFFRRVLTNKVNTYLDASFIMPRKLLGRSLRIPKAKPTGNQIYFVGADQRAARGARPRPDAPGPHGPPHLLPDADQARPAGHLQPLPRQDRPRAGARHGPCPRGARTRDQRLLAGQHRAGLQPRA